MIDDLLEVFKGAKYLSIKDHIAGYHLIRMNSSDINKTAFRTLEGLYEYTV